MNQWYKWWFKWWVWTGMTIFIIIILSEPPRLWFWLVLFILIMLYGFERSINSDS